LKDYKVNENDLGYRGEVAHLLDREIIDLRSDTVSHPTPEMRAAMARAAVGDDVYGEDPTVNKLQDMAAAMVGKEAGLFVPSGTMGNLAAIMAHCRRGEEVILGHLAHTFLYEAGGVSVLGGIPMHTVPNQQDGTIHLADLEAAIHSDDVHFAPSRLIVLENTHNRCGGVSLSVVYTQAVSELADRRGLAVHLDGARLFNAAAAEKVSAAELAAPVDSVTFCLSKGLCAPVGSVICGTKSFIADTHRIRKLLGGGMRQAGVLAAAGIVALDRMVDRLGEDHERALGLAGLLAEIPGLKLDPGPPQTNMVYLSLDPEVPFSAQEVSRRLLPYHVKVGAVGERRFRLVTHYWIDAAAVDHAVTAFKEVLQSN
jgi:threonine aldolase